MAYKKIPLVVPGVTATPYTAGDAVGTLLEFPLALGYPGKSGVIVGIEIIDKSLNAAPLILQLFDRTFTNTADNAAYNPSDADIVNALGNITVASADYNGGTGNKVGTKSASLPFVLPAGGTSLFGQLFTSGTPTYAAGDLTVVLYVEEKG